MRKKNAYNADTARTNNWAYYGPEPTSLNAMFATKAPNKRCFFYYHSIGDIPQLTKY